MSEENALDDLLNLPLDSLPNLGERQLRSQQLIPVRFGIVTDRVFVVRDAIAEMKTGGDGQVGFERKSELSEKAISTGRGMGDEEARLGGIVDALSGIDEFADLQNRRPGRPAAAGDGSLTFAVVEELMLNQSAAETKET